MPLHARPEKATTQGHGSQGPPVATRWRSRFKKLRTFGERWLWPAIPNTVRTMMERSCPWPVALQPPSRQVRGSTLRRGGTGGDYPLGIGAWQPPNSEEIPAAKPAAGQPLMEARRNMQDLFGVVNLRRRIRSPADRPSVQSRVRASRFGGACP